MVDTTDLLILPLAELFPRTALIDKEKLYKHVHLNSTWGPQHGFDMPIYEPAALGTNGAGAEAKRIPPHHYDLRDLTILRWKLTWHISTLSGWVTFLFLRL